MGVAQELKRQRREMRRAVGDAGMQVVDQHTIALNRLMANVPTMDDRLGKLEMEHRQLSGAFLRFRVRTFRERLRWLVFGA